MVRKTDKESSLWPCCMAVHTDLKIFHHKASEGTFPCDMAHWKSQLHLSMHIIDRQKTEIYFRCINDSSIKI